MTPLTQRLFNLKVELIYELQAIQYQESSFISYRTKLVNQLFSFVQQLDQNYFMVRMEIKHVDKFSHSDSWKALTILNVNDLKKHISPLIEPEKDDELAKRFDLWVFTIELSTLTKSNATRAIRQVMESAQELQKLGTIPQILEQKELIKKIQEPEFWEQPTLEALEEVRLALRELIRFIPKYTQKVYYTNFEDEIISIHEDDAPLLKVNDLRSYKEKVENYIRTHLDNTAVYKLHHNRPLTKKDVEMLEEVLWEKLGSKDQYKESYGEKSVTILVRELIGLDKGAAKAVFSNFLSTENLNSQQSEFIKLIIDYVVQNGYLEKAQLLEDPFKRIGTIVNLFGDNQGQIQTLIQSIDSINANAKIIN